MEWHHQMAVLCPEKRLQQKCSETEDSKGHNASCTISSTDVRVGMEELSGPKNGRHIWCEGGICNP